MKQVDLLTALRTWVEVAPSTHRSRLLEEAIDELERLEELETILIRTLPHLAPLSKDAVVYAPNHPDVLALYQLIGIRALVSETETCDRCSVALNNVTTGIVWAQLPNSPPNQNRFRLCAACAALVKAEQGATEIMRAKGIGK